MNGFRQFAPCLESVLSQRGLFRDSQLHLLKLMYEEVVSGQLYVQYDTYQRAIQPRKPRWRMSFLVWRVEETRVDGGIFHDLESDELGEMSRMVSLIIGRGVSSDYSFDAQRLASLKGTSYILAGITIFTEGDRYHVFTVSHPGLDAREELELIGEQISSVFGRMLLDPDDPE